jgi:hypothetical protein
MRVAILTDEADARNGYLNVMARAADPAKAPGTLTAPDGSPMPAPVEFAAVEDLRAFGDAVYPGEADEVVVPAALDFVDPLLVDEYVAAWVGLVAPGGTLSLGGVDLLQLCDRVASGGMTDRQANQVLYGDGRRSSFSAATVAEVLRARGLVVERVLVEGLKYAVVASRPREEKV